MEVERTELITRGAEAEVWKGRWRKRKIIIKKRVKKNYRLPELDEKIRTMRTRKEGRLLSEAKKLGVPVPIIYDIDEQRTELVMQYFHGKRVMDCIEEGIKVDLEKIGAYIGKLHEAKISHGDLTTSNILYDDKKEDYCFIDFSLGEKESSNEYMGVDLHLLREALVSVHDEPLDLFEKVLSGHNRSCEEHEKIKNWIEKIEKRGRYR
ncbi:MAG: Kae1-associated serine/threonine protein kinase [Candidatus Thermoplasmatota archaeon]|nr:Kae1-associated serine/threonine protein kinase [Candidatus Thermoplasmatota archaeon]MBS3790333.1 Kae1-associated serine/threonine protein kinase [Candidatus Thermoplasmatota archaeon]